MHRMVASADEVRFKISDLERLSGVNRSTIHYYVHEGILPKPHMTGRTSAYYDQRHLKRLKSIQRFKGEFTRVTGKSRMPMEMLRALIEREDPLKRSIISKALDIDLSGLDAESRRRTEIIVAALMLYTERGYYRTSVRDIARETGISVPTFYKHFTNKRDLFVAVIEYVIDKFRKEYREALEGTEDWFMMANILIESFHDNYPLIGEVLNQLRAGVAANDPWAKERLRKIYADLTADFPLYIRKAIHGGFMREFDEELLAYIIINLAEATYQRVSFDDKYEFEDIAEAILDLMYKGLGPR